MHTLRNEKHLLSVLNFPSFLVAGALLCIIKSGPLGARGLLYFYLVCSSSWLDKLSIISMFILDESDTIVDGFNIFLNDFAGEKPQRDAIIDKQYDWHSHKIKHIFQVFYMSCISKHSLTLSLALSDTH